MKLGQEHAADRICRQQRLVYSGMGDRQSRDRLRHEGHYVSTLKAELHQVAPPWLHPKWGMHEAGTSAQITQQEDDEPLRVTSLFLSLVEILRIFTYHLPRGTVTSRTGAQHEGHHTGGGNNITAGAAGGLLIDLSQTSKRAELDVRRQACLGPGAHLPQRRNEAPLIAPRPGAPQPGSKPSGRPRSVTEPQPRRPAPAPQRRKQGGPDW
ncbi:hypothetical protein AAFF_G00282910 [Aldrovandia affinis]|uniref:Uncharacterized protein n=1 Tax=Aldrovandia affinis TaxID=143900 RepID=A0AAD7T9W7_9TELE|nr:hypothetical protein AAFF_G00282910 [Aldrovandia affinis]